MEFPTGQQPTGRVNQVVHTLALALGATRTEAASRKALLAVLVLLNRPEMSEQEVQRAWPGIVGALRKASELHQPTMRTRHVAAITQAADLLSELSLHGMPLDAAALSCGNHSCLRLLKPLPPLSECLGVLGVAAGL